MIKKGTIVVRTGGSSGCASVKFKEVGVIFETTSDSTCGQAHYGSGGIHRGDYRLATFREIKAYHSGIRNISDIAISTFDIYF